MNAISHNLRAFCLLLASGLMLPAGGLAQQAEQAPPTVKTPAPLQLGGETEVVVTASRGGQQSLLEVPQSINIVSRNDMETREYNDIDDAIRQLPNVSMAPAEGVPNWWQEGFTIRGLGAQRTLVLADGVRQSGQGIGYGGGNLSLYDTYNIEKIEVLRGPGSVLYGTDAFGGVVNVITRNPKRRSEAGVNSGARYVWDGSADKQRGSAYLDFGDSEYSSVIGGSVVRSLEPKLPRGEDPMSGSYQQWNIWGKADFFFAPDARFRVQGDMNRARDILIMDDSLAFPIATFPPPGAQVPVSSPFYIDMPEYNRSLLGGELVLDDLSETFERFTSGLHWQQTTRKFFRQTPYYGTGSPGFAGPPMFVDPAANVSSGITSTRDRVNTLEWQNQGRFQFDSHQLTSGFDFGYDHSRLPETAIDQVLAVAGAGPVYREPVVVERVRAEAYQTRYGLYLQDTFSLNSFAFTPGMRFDYFNVQDQQTDFSDDVFGLSGSLGSIYNISDEQTVYLNLASGFRAPDLGERFQNAIVNFGAPTNIIGNPDLDPERSWSAELGSKLDTHSVSYELAGFVNKVQDYIGENPLGIIKGMVTEQYENMGDVTFYGAEAAVTWHMTEKLDLYGNAGRTWTTEDEKADVPNFIFNYGLRLSQPVNCETLRTLYASVYLRSALESTQKTSNPGRTAFPDNNSFTTVNAELNFDLGDTEFGKGRIISGMRNIFNQAYREPFFNMLQPGRNVYAGLQFDF